MAKSRAFYLIFTFLLRSNSLEELQLAFVTFLLFMAKDLPGDNESNLIVSLLDLCIGQITINNIDKLLVPANI